MKSASRSAGPKGVRLSDPAFDITSPRALAGFIADRGILRLHFRGTIRRLLAGPYAEAVHGDLPCIRQLTRQVNYRIIPQVTPQVTRQFVRRFTRLLTRRFTYRLIQQVTRWVIW